MKSESNTIRDVKEYYGKVLQHKDDLKTGACCTADSLPKFHQEILRDVEEEIQNRFYGCGSPIPHSLEGCTVLDLGCGTGRDVFVVSKLVGEQGKVIGIDMTTEQLSVARQYQESQAKRFGFDKPNTEFIKGYIEDLKAAGIPDNSVDVVISNCVINLSPQKNDVFKEILRVLKPGGELYFSDIYADRRIPMALREDAVLYGECLSGAMYIEDFRRLIQSLGVADFRAVQQSVVPIIDPQIEKLVGHINFYSITYRIFKIHELEDVCEDFGQVAIYRGGIEHAEHRFVLDDHHIFDVNKPMLVCGNTSDMIQKSRFGKYFEVVGDKTNHLGKFEDCGTPVGGEPGLSACC